MNDLAIVVTAYNRDISLKTLLTSLNKVVYDKTDIHLIISIDNFGTPEVVFVANDFKWKYGDKEVIVHKEKLGLRNHFIWAGDQTSKYENVLFLEDDLFVSPFIFDFVGAYLKNFSDDNRIAGCSLYNPILCEFTGCKFYQIDDGFDNYFFQHPYWGNIWSRKKWFLFKEWFLNYKCRQEILPSSVQKWNETSFKKVFIQYLIETNRFIVYPRMSYVTNMGEAGLHSFDSYKQFQVVLANGHRILHLSSFDDSLSKYDAFFELDSAILKKQNKKLEMYDFDVDLQCSKTNFTKEYVLTRRKTTNDILSFASKLRPIENNIIFDISDGDIVLAKTNDVIISSSRMFKYGRIVEDVLVRNYCLSKKILLACFLPIKK